VVITSMEDSMSTAQLAMHTYQCKRLLELLF